MPATDLNSTYSRAVRLYHKGFVRPALDVIELHLAELPDDARLLLLRAAIHHSQGNWKEALATSETVEALIPLPPSAQLIIADCYSHLEKHELALMGYRHLLCKFDLPVHYYAALYAGFKRAGQHELAYESCQKAIQLDRRNHAAWFGLAHCMSKLAFPPKEVTAAMQRALELAPEQANYRISLVLQLMLTKHRQGAYELLKQRPIELLATLDRCFLIRQLMNLCAWAGDVERCSYLGGLLARITLKSMQERSH